MEAHRVWKKRNSRCLIVIMEEISNQVKADFAKIFIEEIWSDSIINQQYIYLIFEN